MAEPMKIINNPSITSGSFTIDDGKIVAIAGMPLAGSGGGTQSDFVYVPSFNDETGDISFILGVTGAEGKGPWHISGTPGPKGEDGAQGEPGNDACPITAASAEVDDGVHVTISYTSGGNALTEFDILDGYDGNDGKTPEFSANPVNAHLLWKYSGDSNWTDFGFAMSGEKGPQGLSGNSGKDGISPTAITATIAGGNRVTFTYGEGSSTYIDVMSGASGANGKDGISPTVSTETIAGGNRVTFTYGEGSTKSIDVMSGASGANGSDGFSPTVTVTNIPADPSDPNHKKGGTEITITDATTTNKFSAWNGNDGTMAGAPDITGFDGITARNTGTIYEIGLSSDYKAAIQSVSSKLDESDFTTYTATTAPDAFQAKGNYLSANALNGYATETWVGEQGYLKQNDIVGKADKTELETVSGEIVDMIPSLNGYATEQYVQAASAEVTAWVDDKHYLTTVPDYYITETELANYNYATISLVDEASAKAYNDATANADSLYLTKNAAAETYQPKGNYLSANALNGYATEQYVQGASAEVTAWVVDKHYLVANDIAGKADKTDLQYISAGVEYVSGAIPDTSDMATQTWVGQQGYLTAIPSEYITETELADYNYVTTATTNSLSSEIEEISSTLNDKYTLSAGTGIYFYEDSINKTTRIDCTVTAATTVAQLTDSANYYTINQTSAASELTTEFAKYALLANIPTKVTDLADSANYVVTGDILTGTGNKLTGIKIGSTNYTVPTTDLSNYYTKSQTSAASALSAEFAKYLTSVITDTTLTGDGTDNSHKLGVAWSTLSGNTIVSAKSANSTEYITNGIGYSGFNDISAKFGSLSSYVPFSATVLPIGTSNTATTNAAAIGGLNSAVDLSFALGNANTAKTTGCAIGEHNFAYNKSVAIGYQNTADYNVDIAIGYQCSAHDHGAAFINLCTASNQSIAAGNKCFAYAGSVAFGNCTSAYDNSVALGHGSDSNYNIANNYSFLAGDACSAFSYSQAFGRGVVASGNPAGTEIGLFAIGGWNATTANALFVIGNGSWYSGKRDALVVHNDGTVSAKQFQNADGTDTINETTYNFTGVDNIEILPNEATANTANFPNDNVLRFILES